VNPRNPRPKKMLHPRESAQSAAEEKALIRVNPRNPRPKKKLHPRESAQSAAEEEASST
jgi:hypothetical protein